MDSDLVRKCPVFVIAMRLNAEICNGHGTFPDKFAISDPPFPIAISDSFRRDPMPRVTRVAIRPARLLQNSATIDTSRSNANGF
jgi:hypothetical protein